MPERGGLDAERARLRERLGRVGLWSFQLDRLTAASERRLAGEIDRLGFGSLWVAEGTASKEALTHSGVLLAASAALRPERKGLRRSEGFAACGSRPVARRETRPWVILV